MGANFRYDDPHTVVVPVDSGTVISAGDLVYLDTDDAKPFDYDSNSDGTGDNWDTDLLTTQATLQPLFLGVAIDRSQSGETNPIRVSTNAVWDFDCASATFEIGDLVGPAKATGNNLEAQKVVAVADEHLAVGRVEERVGSANTRVRVRIQSAIKHGAIQAPGAAAKTMFVNVGTVAATGSAQGDAAALNSDTVLDVVSAGDDTTGVVLPTAVPGTTKMVLNSGSAGLKIYPATGDAINNGSANAAITILEDTLAILVATAADNWAATFTANS